MKMLLAGVCAAASLPLFAETFTLKQVPSSLSDWKSPAFYVEDAAPTGASSDEVVIPLGMTVTVSTKTDAESVAFLKSMGNIKPAITRVKGGSIAKFVIDVDEADTVEWIGSFSSYVEDNISGNYSHVQKTGKGILKLMAQGADAYKSRWVISEGTLWLPAPNTSSYHYKYYGTVIVEKNGTVRTDQCTGNSIWQVGGLFNDGVVQNGTSASTTVYLGWDLELPEPRTCDGKFLGGFYFNVRCGKLDLMGTENTFGSNVRLSGETRFGSKMSEVTVANFGLKADAASSLGVADPALHMEGDIGARIVYTGKGETSDKDFRLIAGTAEVTAPNEINGGEDGGLRLTGAFTKYDSSTVWNPLIVFGGDNATPCEFAGGNADFEFHANAQSLYYGRVYTRYIKKTGTGEWHFPLNTRFTGGGTVAVADGTLSYDVLDAKGRLCSLGTATRCFAESAAQPLEENRVNYAILLGGDSEAETGYLESRADTVQQCTDRPFGLKGRGGFRANCGEVRYANVFGVTAKPATLLLDGTNGFENIVCDVSDGMAGGTVSIEKNGTNTWVLGGDQTFTGALTVNGGKLIVRRPAQTYRRYRLVVKEIVDNNQALLDKGGNKHKNMSGLTMAEVGLWDSDNRRINMNLAFNDDYRTLQPGQCAWGWTLTGPTALATELLFDGNRMTATDDPVGRFWGAIGNQSFTSYGTLKAGARQDDPLTWTPLDMYLAEGEKSLDHFDILGADTAGPEHTLPAIVQMFASVDGLHWDPVSDLCTYDHTSTRYCWLSNGNGGSGSNGSYDNGYKGRNSPDTSFFNRAAGWKLTNSVPTKVFSLLEHVGAVTVANGATLKYEGAAEGAPALSSVKLASGATGSIDGFAFAEDGTFEIDAMPEGSAHVAVTLPNATGLGNVANWQVKVGGVLKPSYSVKATANGFQVTKSGLMMILR